MARHYDDPRITPYIGRYGIPYSTVKHWTKKFVDQLELCPREEGRRLLLGISAKPLPEIRYKKPPVSDYPYLRSIEQMEETECHFKREPAKRR